MYAHIRGTMVLQARHDQGDCDLGSDVSYVF